ncbi:MAG: hypothetical protein JW839_02200 [Candidatus Lokiarchaeota archaeon]|nr:hypothetical protein [Candidatus Lokiarchaeota archaeon]
MGYLKRRHDAWCQDIIRNNATVQRIHPTIPPLNYGSIRCPRCFRAANVVYQADSWAKQGQGNFIVCGHCGYKSGLGLRQFGAPGAMEHSKKHLERNPAYVEEQQERRR